MNGEYTGPERRGVDPVDNSIQQSIIKLLSKMESIEATTGVKLEAIKESINSLKQNIDLKVDHLQDKLTSHEEGEKDINDRLAAYDSKMSHVPTYLQRLNNLENDVESMKHENSQRDKDIADLKNAPDRARSRLVTSAGNQLWGVLWAAIGAGGLAIFYFIIKLFTKAQAS